jgi:hypothetical protein
MEIKVRLRCVVCDKRATVTYEPPYGEAVDAARAMGKVALISGWQVNTVVSRFDGSVLAHDLCPEHAEKPIAVGEQ